MKQLSEGQQVNLVSDPTQDAVDRFGRSLFYVDRTDGVDVGEEMIRAGWADVFVFDQDFQRLPRYRAARARRGTRTRGVGTLRRGLPPHAADELRERRLAAVAFMRRYYRRISHRQFASRLGDARPAAAPQARPLLRVEGGVPPLAGVSVLSATARLSGAGR